MRHMWRNSACVVADQRTAVLMPESREGRVVLLSTTAYAGVSDVTDTLLRVLRTGRHRQRTLVISRGDWRWLRVTAMS